MNNFLVQGGLVGMLVITSLGAASIIIAIYVSSSMAMNKVVSYKLVNSILYLGSMSFFAGLVWTALGLYEVLEVIQRMGEVSQSALAGGLKAACISTIWGLFLFFIAYVCWYLLRLKKIE